MKSSSSQRCLCSSWHCRCKRLRKPRKLYERLGGVFAIAAVIDHFSDAVVQNPIVGTAEGRDSGRSPTSFWLGMSDPSSTLVAIAKCRPVAERAAALQT